jgi:hypothetical protein
MLLVQRHAQQGLDDSLAADVQFSRGLIQFIEHGNSKIHIDALNGRHHLALSGEKARDVLAAIGDPGNCLG